MQRLCGDLDRLSRDKIDLTSLEHYSQRISSLFEGVAQGLADEVAVVVSQLRVELAGVSRNSEEARSRDKVRPGQSAISHSAVLGGVRCDRSEAH